MEYSLDDDVDILIIKWPLFGADGSVGRSSKYIHTYIN